LLPILSSRRRSTASEGRAAWPGLQAPKRGFAEEMLTIVERVESEGREDFTPTEQARFRDLQRRADALRGG